MVTMSGPLGGATALPRFAPEASISDLSERARAYLKSNNATRSDQSAQNDTDRDPAVRLTLSNAAMAASTEQSVYQKIGSLLQDQFGLTLQDGESWEDGVKRLSTERFMQRDGQRSIEVDAYFDDMHGAMEIRRQMVELNTTIKAHQLDREQLADLQADYKYYLNIKPVPRQELHGEEKEAAFKLLSDRGYARPGQDHTVSFSIDHTTYMFMGDGSVWTNDGRVPTSEAAKQGVLDTLSRRIGYGQQDSAGKA